MVPLGGAHIARASVGSSNQRLRKRTVPSSPSEDEVELESSVELFIDSEELDIASELLDSVLFISDVLFISLLCDWEFCDWEPILFCDWEPMLFCDWEPMLFCDWEPMLFCDREPVV